MRVAKRNPASVVVAMISHTTNRACALVVAVALSAANAHASRPGHDLASLVNSSDFIVFGTVENVSKAPLAESQGEKIFGSTLKIETCFKRTIGPFPQVGPKIKYSFLTGGPEDPTIQIGHKYMLFLKDSDIGPYPLDGAVGVIPVEIGKAKTGIVAGEPTEQAWDTLQQRVKALARDFGCPHP